MKLSIFYTNNCNIHCDHCFLGTQTSKNVMSFDMLLNVLSQAKEVGISSIAITGGEPFLYLNSIIDAINFSNLNDSKISFATNGFWANSINNTNTICAELQRIRVTQLEISCDEYHIKHIPLVNVFNIIRIAPKYGILVKIIMSISNNMSFLYLYSKLLRYIKPENIIIQRTALFGSAKHNNIDCSIEIEKFKAEKCRQVLNPCITYSGDVFACCGPCIVSKEKNDLYLGNLHHNTLKFAINKMMSNQTILKIAKDGPFSVASEVPKQECSSLCEFCMKTL